MKLNSYILIGIIMLMLVVPMVSAYNDKSFIKDSKYGKITITDKGLFGLSNTKLAEITLIDNSMYCASDCYAEGITTIYSKEKLFDSVKFKDKKNQLKSYSYKWLIKEDGKWTEYKNEKLDAGTYEWRLEGKKGTRESIDWIATSFGMELNEWIWWNSWQDWSDDFNDNSLNTTFWKNDSAGCVFAGDWAYLYPDENSGSYAMHSYYQAGGGDIVQTYMYLVTKQDFKDNRDYNINFTLSSNGLHNNRIMIVNTTSPLYTLNCAGSIITPIIGTQLLNQIGSYSNKQYNITIDASLNNITLWNASGIVNSTTTSLSNWYILFDTYYHCGACSLQDRTYNISDFGVQGEGVNTIFNYPINYYNTSDNTPDLSCNFTGLYTTNISNVTIKVYDSSNNLDYSDTVLNNTFSWTKIWTPTALIDDVYNWSCYVTGDDNNQWNTNNRTFTIDTTAPIVNITYPINGTTYTDNYGYAQKTVILNWTVTDIHLSNCWYSNSTANATVTCSDNTTSFNVPYGNYVFYFYANDTFGNINSSWVNVTYVLNTTENSQTFNTSTYETASETFKINITSSILTEASANLYYNGTSYAGTKTISGSNIIFTRAIDIPTSAVGSNTSFFWSITFGNSSDPTVINYNSTLKNQTVLPIIFNLCNSTNNISYINFTFKNETYDSYMNGAISTSTFEYWLGGGSVTKSLTFINNSENPSYAFCLTPKDRTVNIDYEISYLATGFPQRNLDPSTVTFTNTTTNKILYLLDSSNGIYVTFIVVNSADQVLSDVNIDVKRTIGSTLTTIATGTTDNAGSYTFWLNSNVYHTITFSKTGYTDFTTSLYPTQSIYTITLGGESTEASDCTRGVNYNILPSLTTLKNNTLYNFNFTTTSNYWILDGFGFTLRNSSGTSLGSASSTANGGTVSANQNTNNLTAIFMDYYWIANSTYCNMTRSWIIYDDTANNEWSISNFFTDLRTYMATGMFGLTNFGLTLIIFVVIFVIVGIMSYKFGLTSPGAILLMITGLIFFFDIAIGILPAVVGERFAHFLWIFTGLISMAMIYWEVTKY